MPKKIFLCSAPKGSGKTTRLFDFVQRQRKIGKRVVGVLQPNRDGVRHIVTLSNDNSYALEINHHTHTQSHTHNDSHSPNKVLHTPCFTFDDNMMRIARQELHTATRTMPHWVIIDEIGPLEIRKHQGYEPAFTTLLHSIQDTQNAFTGVRVVVVVRPKLKQEFLKHYKINPKMVGTFEEIEFVDPALNELDMIDSEKGRQRKWSTSCKVVACASVIVGALAVAIAVWKFRLLPQDTRSENNHETNITSVSDDDKSNAR